MSDVLLTGIKTLWDSTDGATVRGLTTGGLWAGVAPHGAKLPYVRMTSTADQESENGSFGTGGMRYEERTILTFSVFVEDYQASAGWAIMRALQTLVENTRPTLASGWYVKQVKRLGAGIEIPDPDGGYQISMDVRYVYEKTS